MVKRLKVGAKTNMFVVLEATTLTIFKNKSAPPRHVINVRATPVTVDVPKRELHVCVSVLGPGKDKLLRLHIPSQDDAYRWKHALESAVNSDITDYYTFGKTLGSGAYGDVVQAFDVRTNEKRAVKIIKRGSNMKSRQHLECEIECMKSISHPNIVQTYQIFDLKRTIYIVMEYVEGGDLFDFVAQHDCLTEAQGSQTIRSIFQAVEYLHRHSIVHRDLKPENILCINKSWPLHVKVTDFGFASFLDPATDTDNTMRTQVGTAYFMAPEIISNQGHGPAVDSWACGVILYTILTGRLPFPGKNTTEYFNNVVQAQPLFPAVLWKGISPDAMSLVKGLLNGDPKKRLTSLGALQHRWICSPDSYENEIRRDRSNLHSRRRRLFKARKAIIAVAMANKFKATIPQMVDKVGDGTKKVAENIGQGVKKTADGIGEGVKKTAEGVKKVGDGIGEGTKKVAGGIGTGVKKTVDGVESGAKKVGEGLKKTGDGIETGFKKTGEGFKKTGEGIKRTVEKVKIDRDKRGAEWDRSNTNGGDSHTESTRESGRRRPLFKRRNNGSRSVISGTEVLPRPNDVPSLGPGARAALLKPAAIGSSMSRRNESADDNKYSSSEYYSAMEEHSVTEEGWESIHVMGEGLDLPNVIIGPTKSRSQKTTSLRSNVPTKIVKDNARQKNSQGFPDVKIGSLDTTTSVNLVSQTSTSSSANSSRPKLPPLDGLTMGLSNECMGGSSSRDANLGS